jgi:hypothetical protein
MEPFYMTDKEIMQQALDTLRGLFGIHSDSGGVAVWRLGGSSAVKDAITALRSRLAQLEDEPEWAIPPKETPQQKPWIGLTDDEIKGIIGAWGDTPIKGYTRKLFDQIETKLKEKNT